MLCETVEACLWVTGTTKDGQHIKVLGRKPTYTYRRALEADIKAKGEKLVHAFNPAADSSFDQKNNYAVGLIYLGRTDEAIQLLEKLEKEEPGSYFAAANLGTAYELSGRNSEALRWIQESIRRNTNSHYGTEWVHVKILEAKVQHEKDPAYFDTHSVIGIDPNQAKSWESEFTIAGQKRTVHQICEAIDYQLLERLQFVRGKDPGVASLLFDRALLEAAAQTLESAAEVLNVAADFGYPRSRIDPLLAQYSRTIAHARVRQIIFWVSLAITAVALLVYAHRRSRRRAAA